MDDLRTNFRNLEKSDLHNHLHLGVDIKFIQEKYSNMNFNVPTTYDGLEGMIDFIHSDVNRLLNTEEDVVYFMEKSIQSAINDGITYLEASVDINLVKYFTSQSVEDLISHVARIKDKYARQITFKPDIGLNKDLSSERINTDGIRCVESGIFNGIDIYGREHNQNLNKFISIYELAAKNNLKKKVHIGEFSAPETIESAIKLLNPHEIQHGIWAVDSEKVQNMILERNIRLNICPQSNIALGSVKDLASHPIRKLYDRGIQVTINSDDYLLFDSTITDQCIELVEQGIFSFDEVKQILSSSVES